MKTLMIMHEVCMLIAEALIIWSVIKVHRKADVHWFKNHPMLAFIGILFALLSFGFIFAYKEIQAYPHFLSFHAVIGIITLTLLLCNFSVGVALKKGWAKVRSIHKALGKIAACFVITTAISGVLRFIEILRS